MNAQCTAALAVKELKRITREPANLFLAFIFPLVLTLAFGMSFGAIGGGEQQYKVAFVTYDNSQYSGMLHDTLAKVSVLNVVDYSDVADANSALSQGRVSAVLVVPSGFGESIASYLASPDNPSLWVTSTLELSLDKGSIIASSAISPIISNVLNVMVSGGQAQAAIPVTISAPTLVDASKLTQFSLMAPGMFTYAAIFLIMLVAQSLVSEREQGLLTRISVTPTSTRDIFASQITSNLLIGVVQTCMIFGASTVMGFKPLGGWMGISVAFLAVALLTLCSVGFGLITATFAKNNGAATGISFAFILPLMFLGTFVPAPESISRLVPSWYLTDALTSIFIRGADAFSPAIISDLSVLACSSIGVILAGVILYSRYGNR
jgi:ABC-type multidrug transport system permease subunit